MKIFLILEKLFVQNIFTDLLGQENISVILKIFRQCVYFHLLCEGKETYLDVLIC